jgi:hypothetical protein
MSYLETLRAIALAANDVRPLDPIDSDLAIEAGMDGNYARYLQAARNLDKRATAGKLAKRRN